MEMSISHSKRAEVSKNSNLWEDIRVILRRLCEYKYVEIIEVHAMPDYIHMLLPILRS